MAGIEAGWDPDDVFRRNASMAAGPQPPRRRDAGA